MKQVECNPMRLLAGACALALGLLGVGMAAASASAQTLAVSNQVFPLT